MKMRRVLSFLLTMAMIFSMFAMSLSAGAAAGEPPIKKETRSRTVNGYYTDEEMMEILNVDYETLQRMSKDAYTAMMTNTMWDVSAYGVKRNTPAADALFDLIAQNPECFFITGYGYYRSGETITGIIGRYALSYEESMKMHSEMVAAVQEILCMFRRYEDLTDLELALLVHDYLAANYEYYVEGVVPWVDDWGARYSAYGLLVKGSAVCQGYAETYAYLMTRLGIPCSMCLSSELNHAWNILELDGLDYHVDVTWDDPTKDRSGYVRHTNFLRSTEGIKATGHTAEDLTAKPTNTEYDTAFWQNSYTAFCMFNGTIYYVADRALYSWVDGVSTKLLPLEYRWPASATTLYTRSYTILNTDGESLFLTTPRQVLKYIPESNTTEVVYTYTNTDNLYNIYGLAIRNNNLYIEVNNSATFSDTTKKENQIVIPYRTGSYEVHIYDSGTVTTVPTCTTAGVKTYTCTACNTTKTEEIAALGHIVTSKVTPPTCTEQGYTTHSCSRCGRSNQDTYVPATGHSYTSKVVTDATCTADGVKSFLCSACSHSYTEAIAATGHTPVTDEAIVATCTQTGLTEGSHCSVCNAVLMAQEIVEATGHTPVTDEAVAATCTQTGLTEGSHCSVCNAVLVAQEIVEATGHTPVTDEAVAATCTQTGLTEGSHCSVCNAVLVAQEIVEATGHTPVTDEAVAATCTQTGLTEGSHCSVCNAVLVAQETVAALGHEYACIDNCNGTHTGTCARCGDSITENHSFANGECVCGGKEILVDENMKILHTLDLASDISITFAVPMSALAGYDNYYLECILPEYEGNEQIGTSTIQIQPVVSGNYYYFTLTGITAVRMGDMVDAVLYMTKGAQTYRSNTDSYSVATYAYGMLNSTTNAKMLTLCADLLRYGAEAQTYKGYRTDALVDAAMTEAQRDYLSDTEALTFTATDSNLEDIEGPVVHWVGKTLDLASKVGVKFVFDAANYGGDIANLSMTVMYQNSDGEMQTVVLTDAEVYNGANGYYSFAFYGLLASELRTVVEVMISEGDIQLSESVRYSMETYAEKTEGTALEPLTRALFAYSDSAKAYFTK